MWQLPKNQHRNRGTFRLVTESPELLHCRRQYFQTTVYQCSATFYKIFNQSQNGSIQNGFVEHRNFHHTGILADFLPSKYENFQMHSPPVDLYLIFEKSSCKNQVRQSGFLVCKNQLRNWFLQATQAVKIQFAID